GTAQKGDDSGILLYDLRNLASPVKAYMDAHSDDVVSVDILSDPFLLLSGGDDGLVNVYDPSITDPDEVIGQSINVSGSIHQSGFRNSKKIFALTRMETFSEYRVLSEEETRLTAEGTTPIIPLTADKKDYGDIRDTWGCEYVSAILPEFIGIGSNSTGEFSLLPYTIDGVDTVQRIVLQGAHGLEVVRSVL
ncbi:hypothetical protein CANCADRAFT_13712, partial [Tortispora caseinolytica NRRL Y-17796]